MTIVKTKNESWYFSKRETFHFASADIHKLHKYRRVNVFAPEARASLESNFFSSSLENLPKEAAASSARLEWNSNADVGPFDVGWKERRKCKCSCVPGVRTVSLGRVCSPIVKGRDHRKKSMKYLNWKSRSLGDVDKNRNLLPTHSCESAIVVIRRHFARILLTCFTFNSLQKWCLIFDNLCGFKLC